MKNIDAICWKCERSRLHICPKTTSHEAPEEGSQKCDKFITNPHVDYGNSPRKKLAMERLLKKTK